MIRKYATSVSSHYLSTSYFCAVQQIYFKLIRKWQSLLVGLQSGTLQPHGNPPQPLGHQDTVSWCYSWSSVGKAGRCQTDGWFWGRSDYKDTGGRKEEWLCPLFPCTPHRPLHCLYLRLKQGNHSYKAVREFDVNRFHWWHPPPLLAKNILKSDWIGWTLSYLLRLPCRDRICTHPCLCQGSNCGSQHRVRWGIQVQDRTAWCETSFFALSLHRRVQ